MSRPRINSQTESELPSNNAQMPTSDNTGSISSENNGTMSKNDKKHFVGASTHPLKQINESKGSISSENKVLNDGPDEKHLTATPYNVLPQNINNVTGEDKQIKDFFLNLASKRNIGTCNHNDVTRFGLNAGLTEMQLDKELHDCAMGRQRTLSDYFYHVICKLHSVKGNQFNLGFVEKHLRQCQLNLIADVLKNSITNSR